MNPLIYLACFSKINHRRSNQLAAYFFDLNQIITASYKELVRAGLDEETSLSFISWRDDNPPEKVSKILADEGMWAIALDEKDYPTLLGEIADPPLAIFVRGRLPPNDYPSLSVVGTRRVTPYGKMACESLVKPIAAQGVAIVSGLALGLDAIAHETALQAKGITIAVLGGGIDRATVSPRANQRLAERIIDSNGAIISEYPPGYPPDVYTFPARNRIIAGLSKGTLVIEAPRSSGSLITASCALDYNREVMAIPHQINAIMGEGCNTLIKQGARAVTDYKEVLETIGISSLAQDKLTYETDLTAAEQKIFSILDNEPKHLDLIIELTALSSAEAASATAMLEIKNRAKNIGGMKYIKAF